MGDNAQTIDTCHPLQPEEQEYYYDSENLVVDMDAEFPDISQHMWWKAARQVTAPLPLR